MSVDSERAPNETMRKNPQASYRKIVVTDGVLSESRRKRKAAPYKKPCKDSGKCTPEPTLCKACGNIPKPQRNTEEDSETSKETSPSYCVGLHFLNTSRSSSSLSNGPLKQKNGDCRQLAPPGTRFLRVLDIVEHQISKNFV